ncbi:Pathogenesis-related thaumatin superfamily protein [Zea mays]|uniref:Pathogenesis-related thaumatin superfamily protein n=1 Tax=Zea mays TaxID=4577 RepID=A0A1D6JVS7_MAIZE|nr:Pathogenesis-related thaumatin superfamily protein [Zea mays]
MARCPAAHAALCSLALLLLLPAARAAVDAPAGWSGRVWARTLCAADAATGRFSCATGDCGSGAVQCNGGGAAPPATLAEFTLGGSGGLDFFDVSLVDGYNVPMLIVPAQGAGGGGSSSSSNGSAGGSSLCPLSGVTGPAIKDSTTSREAQTRRVTTVLLRLTERKKTMKYR